MYISSYLRKNDDGFDHVQVLPHAKLVRVPSDHLTSSPETRQHFACTNRTNSRLSGLVNNTMNALNSKCTSNLTQPDLQEPGSAGSTVARTAKKMGNLNNMLSFTPRLRSLLLNVFSQSYPLILTFVLATIMICLRIANCLTLFNG